MSKEEKKAGFVFFFNRIKVLLFLCECPAQYHHPMLGGKQLKRIFQECFKGVAKEVSKVIEASFKVVPGNSV